MCSTSPFKICEFQILILFIVYKIVTSLKLALSTVIEKILSIPHFTKQILMIVQIVSPSWFVIDKVYNSFIQIPS